MVFAVFLDSLDGIKASPLVAPLQGAHWSPFGAPPYKTIWGILPFSSSGHCGDLIFDLRVEQNALEHQY